MADPFLQDAVRWQPYCVFDPLDFEKLINVGIGETRVGPTLGSLNSDAKGLWDEFLNSGVGWTRASKTTAGDIQI